MSGSLLNIVETCECETTECAINAAINCCNSLNSPPEVNLGTSSHALVSCQLPLSFLNGIHTASQGKV